MENMVIEGLKERISKAITVNQSVGIILPGNNYNDFMQALFEYVQNRLQDAWVYVSITRPYENIIKQFEGVTEIRNLKFIDCISQAVGISQQDPRCIYIESPTLLEKLGMEITNIFKEVPETTNKYLVFDSLSRLMVYNDPETVTEFVYYIANKTRADNIHSISVVIEEEGIDTYLNKIIYINDKILKVRDSFI